MTVSEWFKLGMAEAGESEAEREEAFAARLAEVRKANESLRFIDDASDFLMELAHAEKQRKREVTRSVHRRILCLAMGADQNEAADDYANLFFNRRVRRKRRVEHDTTTFYWAVDAHYLISEWSRHLLDVLAALARTGLLSSMVARRFKLYLSEYMRHRIRTRFTVSTGIQPARKAVTLRTIQACAP